MCLLWRSPTTWSPEFTSGDFIFNWVIAGSGMLEIGARQLHNWRLHEPPTSFPSANLTPRQRAYTVAWCHVITSDYQGGTDIHHTPRVGENSSTNSVLLHKTKSVCYYIREDKKKWANMTYYFEMVGDQKRWSIHRPCWERLFRNDIIW